MPSILHNGKLWSEECEGSTNCLLIAADDPALGAPVEYIDLRGTSYDNPMVCKYTGEGARVADLFMLYMPCRLELTHTTGNIVNVLLIVGVSTF